MAERSPQNLRRRAESDELVNVWDEEGKPVAIAGEPEKPRE